MIFNAGLAFQRSKGMLSITLTSYGQLRITRTQYHLERETRDIKVNPKIYEAYDRSVVIKDNPHEII